MQPGKYLKYKLVEKMRKRSGSGSGIDIFLSCFIITSGGWGSVIASIVLTWNRQQKAFV